MLSRMSRTTLQMRLDSQRDRARKFAEVRRHAVRHHRKHRHAERLGGLGRDAFREDAVDREPQVAVLLGAAERQHGAVVVAAGIPRPASSSCRRCAPRVTPLSGQPTTYPQPRASQSRTEQLLNLQLSKREDPTELPAHERMREPADRAEWQAVTHFVVDRRAAPVDRSEAMTMYPLCVRACGVECPRTRAVDPIW